LSETFYTFGPQTLNMSEYSPFNLITSIVFSVLNAVQRTMCMSMSTTTPGSILFLCVSQFLHRIAYIEK